MEAHEQLEQVEQAHHAAQADPFAKRVALAVAVMAVALSVIDTAAKGSQTEYISQHVEYSNQMSFYQGKAIRRTIYQETADVLEGSTAAGASDRREKALAEAKRMKEEPVDGGDAIMTRVKEIAHARENALHRFHGLERGVGMMQVAIVLASVSVLTRIKLLLAGSLLVAAGAVAWSLATVFHLI